MSYGRKLCSFSYSFHRFKFHNFHPANPSFYINPLRNTASLNFLRSVIISKLVPENPKFLDFRSSCFVRNSSFVDPGFVRSYCSARNSDGGTTDWTEEIEYLDESGSVIHKGKGVRSVEPGLDDHVMVGGMKRPFMNASIVAKIVELVKRWKWGPEVETQLDKLQFVPNMIHVTQALKVIKDSDAALSLFRWSKRQSWCSPSEDCFLILFDSLNQSRNFNEIQSLFDEMVQDSTNNGNFSFSACNRVIQYLAKAEKLEVSFCCFKKFQDSGCKVDTQTYNSLITLFLNKGLPYKAFEIYEGMEASHCSLHGSTYELLIPSLAKSGRLDAAFNKLTLTSSYKIDITVTRHY